MGAMDTLAYILKKYDLDPKGKCPIEIPNVGRNDLAGLFKELGFKVGAEVGTEKGIYSKVICEQNPELKLYGIDPWKSYRDYQEHRSQSKLDGFYEETKKTLAPYNVEIVKKFSMDAVKDFKPRSLDFVYIDGNHEFRYVVNDIVEWTRRVRHGGIVSGHDYRREKEGTGYRCHVVEAVQGYTKAYFIRPWFVLGRRAKVEGEIREEHRSWFWVRK